MLASEDTGRVVFVIGPGRSGTTLLYKLLCLHPDVAYLSNLDHRLPWLPPGLAGRWRMNDYESKMRHWFRDRGNAYLVRRSWAHKLVPVPVEGERVYRHSGIPLFPGCGYRPSERAAARLASRFEGLRRAASASVLVSKRTANNRRLPALAAVFPRARFIYLLRDGRDVADSLARVDWWDGHRLWWDPRRRTPRQAVAEGERKLRLCARNWVEETEAIESGLRHVDEERVLRMRYERLVAEPFGEMRRVLSFLGLRLGDRYGEALADLRLGGAGGRWRRTWSDADVAMVNREQAKHLWRLGYQP